MNHIRLETIDLPLTKSLTIGGEEVGNNIQMASGKMVKEIIGFRTILKAEWNYLPQSTITELHRLLRKGGFFHVQYPDPEKGDASGMFSISMPQSGIFRFKYGKPVWKDISLEFTAQEVV